MILVNDVSPEENRILVYTVYLADSFVDIENNKSRFEIIDEDVLSFFSLDKKENFHTLHEILKKSYEGQKLPLNNSAK